MPFDVLGMALMDYYQEKSNGSITTYSSLGEVDTLPLPYLFRDFLQMPKLEQLALESCKGKILDIGCGAGSHSLWLQQKGKNVTALDASAGAITVCKNRGVQKTVQSPILDFGEEKFDTLLLLMNGIGLAGSLQKLPHFLNHLKSLLTVGGQILLDSSDIIYMFDEDEDGGRWVPGNVDYYGEVQFQMEYDGQKGMNFDWLYIDFKTLGAIAKKCGLSVELLANGEHYDYLAKLTRTPESIDNP